MEYELLLSKHFQPHIRTETTIAELAKLLNCSTRYVKTIVQQLHKAGRIKWESFKGRGKKPYITMHRSTEEVMLDAIKTLWSAGKYEEAIQLAKQFHMLDTPAVKQWITQQLGMQTVQGEHVFVQSMYEVELFLDPKKSISRHDSHMMEQIHETLLRIDDSGRLEANLLFAYETADEKVWHFVLRKGIQFHDGSFLTAEEAKQSIEYISPLYAKMYEIEHMTILSRYAFTVTLTKRCPLFLHYLASPRFIMLNKSLQFDIGCGPFRLKTNNAEKIEFVTFEHYFKERPWIDRVELLLTNEAALSPIHYMPPEQEPYETIEQIEQGASYLFMNSRRPAFCDVASRAYIWHRIMSEAFILHPEAEFVANGWLTSRPKLHIDAPPLQKPTFQAPLRIGYQQIRTGANHYDYAKKLQHLLNELHIESELICMNYQQYEQLDFQEIDLFVGGNAFSHDIHLSLYVLYTTSGRQLFTMMNAADKQTAQALLEQAKETDTPDARLYELECFFQTSYHLKFLKHRKHVFYVQANSNFSGVTFDTHGRIHYRRLYTKT